VTSIIRYLQLWRLSESEKRPEARRYPAHRLQSKVRFSFRAE